MVRPRPTCPPRGFTLVELLVVMAIIILLLAATLPALRGPMGVSSRRGAVNTLLGVLDQARALAISENRATYVVFPRPPSPTGSPGSPSTPSSSGTPASDKSARAYAVFADVDDLSKPPQQRSNWFTLPTGIAFKVDEGDGRTRTLLNYPLDPTPKTFVVPGGTGSTPVDIAQPYVKFDATGAVEHPTVSGATTPDPKYFRLLLFEGSVDPANGTELPTKRAAGNTTPETQRFVWEEVRLNYATGRARYTVDPADILVSNPNPVSSPIP